LDNDKRFSLEASVSDKKFTAPNESVRKFAEANFGTYEDYIKEVRRFIKEDSVMLLDALGNEPLFYFQVSKGNYCLEHIRSRYKFEIWQKDVFPKENALYRNFLARKKWPHCVCAIERFLEEYSAQKNAPSHLVFYIENAMLKLSEEEFSVEIYGTHPSIIHDRFLNRDVCVGHTVPVFPVDEHGRIVHIGVTMKIKEENIEQTGSSLVRMVKSVEKSEDEEGGYVNGISNGSSVVEHWGKLYEDPKLYFSLKSVVDATKNVTSAFPLKFEWETGFCKFFRMQGTLDSKLSQYLEGNSSAKK